MAIKGIGIKAGTAATNSHKSTKVDRNSQEASKTALRAKEDFFENSGKLGRVRQLIDDLVQIPEFDAAAVTRGKELLESGALDSPDAFSRAAEGFIEDGAL